MSVKRDYYEVLGLSKGADAGSIKKAYRKLAKMKSRRSLPEKQNTARIRNSRRKSSRSIC